MMILKSLTRHPPLYLALGLFVVATYLGVQQPMPQGFISVVVGAVVLLVVLTGRIAVVLHHRHATAGSAGVAPRSSPTSSRSGRPA